MEPTYQRNNTTGLSDSQHSSSSCASLKYQLAEDDTTPILLYQYRGKGALQTSSQKDLCAWLNKGASWSWSYGLMKDNTDIMTRSDESLRVTKKLIPRGASYIDIKRHDLYLEGEKQMYKHFPNYDSSLASIKIPSGAYWSRLIFGNYYELYIVSPESSANSSIVGDDSRNITPSSTFAKDLDAKLGALAADEEQT